MPRMFVSGSISNNYISDEVIDAIKTSIKKGHQILVGDAPGVDRSIQDILKKNHYKNVKVYHIGLKPRHILDLDWDINGVEVDQSDSKMYKNGKYTREAQMKKDLQMALDADFGLVIWEDVKKNRFGNFQVSKGSLNNIFNLLMRNKPVGLYLLSNQQLGIVKYKKLDEFEDKVIRSLVHSNTAEYYKKIKAEKTDKKKTIKIMNKMTLEQTSLF